ncbi:hypothetical protein JST99_01000 [Candidatus Dependentiae bacterium]|nr:hypothetical protein [Candidatus Dependentiae bacterium]MCC7414779.1 hypothetical protein [Campylobacterota bacterium]
MDKKLTHIALIIVCFFNLNLKPSAGALDATFNPVGTPPGTVRYPTTSITLTGRALAVQTDGSVVIVGSVSTTSNAALVRYTNAGDLDPSFGSGGLVSTIIGTNSAFFGVAIQPDGKIVVAGFGTLAGVDTFLSARYNTDGTLDASFGTGGIVTTPIGATAAAAFDLLLQPDGKIVAAGRSGGITQFVVVRYTTTGTLDGTFGTGGIVTTTLGAATSGNAVTLQPDGKIVVGGQSGSPATFTVVRYTTLGVLDTTFGGTGIVTTTIGGSSTINDIMMQTTTGKIIAVGQRNLVGINNFTIARYNLDGTLDATFGSSGITTTAIGSSCQAFGAAIQQNGSIVASGSSQQPTTTFTLARYTINGTLDTLFGSAGVVLTPYAGSGTSGIARRVVIQNNGRIVAAGVFDNALGGARYFGDSIIIDVCA